VALKSITYNQQTFKISYEIVNPQSKIDFILLHGWGSNKNLMKKSFAPYMKDYRHIYIDLPGFGSSSCDVALYTDNYAKIIDLFLIEIGASKDIVLGHSFGGKVATLLKPKVLVLVSSAGIFVPKPLSIKLKIMLFKFFKLLGLAKFRSLFVAADAKSLSEEMYQTFKNVVDEDFSEVFASYDGLALLCWGKEDSATPLSSSKKIDELIKHSSLIVYDGNHYFFMNYAKDICENIEKTFLKTLGK